LWPVKKYQSADQEKAQPKQDAHFLDFPAPVVHQSELDRSTLDGLNVTHAQRIGE
jgi:hypothetical protein